MLYTKHKPSYGKSKKNKIKEFKKIGKINW